MLFFTGVAPVCAPGSFAMLACAVAGSFAVADVVAFFVTFAMSLCTRKAISIFLSSAEICLNEGIILRPFSSSKFILFSSYFFPIFTREGKLDPLPFSCGPWQEVQYLL